MTDARREPSILLLQIVSPDQYSNYRSELFPFFMGFSKKNGISIRWVRLGVPDEKYSGAGFLILPNENDLKLLFTYIDTNNITHIISNERLNDELRHEIHQKWSDICLADMTVGAQCGTIGNLRKIVGISRKPSKEEHDSEYLVDAYQPVYDFINLNQMAQEIDPFVNVECGPLCLYKKSLKSNHFFSGLSLKNFAHTQGCSFCAIPETTPQYKTPPLELALLQIAAACKDIKQHPLPLQFNLTGVIPFLKLREFVDGLVSEKIRASHFFISARIDSIVQISEVIESVLPIMADVGHSIHLFNVGVENFSAVENERFNKGIYREDIFQGVEKIRSWELKWPKTFYFSKHGGFGFITFTPWTTLTDLKINIKTAKQLDIKFCSLFLTSRLLLLPGRAISQLAEEEGLTQVDFNNSSFEEITGQCITSWRMEEIPWRFLHPEVAAVYALLIRLFPNEVINKPDDYLTKKLIKESSGSYGKAYLAENYFQLIVRVAEEKDTSGKCVQSAEELFLKTKKRIRQDYDAYPQRVKGAGALSTQYHSWFPQLLTNTLVRLMDRLAAPPSEILAGWHMRSIGSYESEDGKRQLRIEMKNNFSCLKLFIRPKDCSSNSFILMDNVCLHHSRDTPVDSPDKKQVSLVVAKILNRLDIFGSSQKQVPGSMEII